MTQPMKERLARALDPAAFEAGLNGQPFRQQAYEEVDAILNELAHPTTEVLSAGMDAEVMSLWERWKAMIQAIKDGK